MKAKLPAKAVNQSTRVYQHNDLMDSVYRLSVSAKRILLMCIANIGDGDTADMDGFTSRISVGDYRALFGGTPAQSSKDMFAAVGELLSASVMFIDVKGGVEYREAFPWLEHTLMVDAKTERGEYQLTLNNRLLAYVGLLEKNYTEYDLVECGRFTSTNQIRLYEKCCQYKNSGIWRTEAAYFQSERYDLGESVKAKPAEIKRRFLLDAIDKINSDATPLFVRFEDVRGKWVFHIYKGDEAQKMTAKFMRDKAEAELKAKEEKRLKRLAKASALPPVGE